MHRSCSLYIRWCCNTDHVEWIVVGPKFSLTIFLLTLVFQFPLSLPVPEKRHTGGIEPAHSEALTPANGQSDAHSPSDEVAEIKHDAEVTEVKCEDNDQHISMVQLHSYIPYYCTTTDPTHPFLQLYPNLFSKTVTLKIKFSYDNWMMLKCWWYIQVHLHHTYVLSTLEWCTSCLFLFLT